MKKTVLGVKIDDLDMDQAVQTVESWLKGKKRHYIVTPNPEIVMMAQSDKDLKEIINKADLAVPDGIGLRLGTDIVCHTPGIDLMEALIKLASEKGFTTGFLGGREGVAEKAAERLLEKYPNLKVVFAESGGEVANDGTMLSDYRLPTTAEDGRQKAVDILFVAFGPPKQEKWVSKNLSKIPVKVAMVVGGSFDYIAGKVTRAPKPVRNLGLEWLFRLVIQPWRIKRQLALIKFLWLVKSKY